jgi:hypothetical protein
MQSFRETGIGINEIKFPPEKMILKIRSGNWVGKKIDEIN